jgi:hypothetical protein
MTDYQTIRHYLDQRQLCLAEVKIKAALANLGEYLTYTQRGEGHPDGFALGVIDGVQQAVTDLSEILERLEPENEYQKQAAIARMLEVKPLSIKAHELFLNTLPREIACAKNVPAQADAKRQADALRYQQAGLMPSEADKLLQPPMSDIERGVWRATAEKLETELDAVGSWLVDVPRFDPSLLAGTRLESMAHE